MKYLKYFEKKTSLKKYVIISHEYTYLVLRINNIKHIKIHRDDCAVISYTSLYNFNKKTNSGAFINEPTGVDSTYDGGKLEEIIVFQSDDLNECLEVLPTLNQSNKFNI